MSGFGANLYAIDCATNPGVHGVALEPFTVNEHLETSLICTFLDFATKPGVFTNFLEAIHRDKTL